MSRPDRTLRAPRPLDDAALERLALRYVERFATTRGRLGDYLARKLRERGWTGEEPADIAALGQRLAHLGYIDDAAFAAARAASLQRRGYGERRVSQALHAAGIGEEDAVDANEQVREGALEAALRFAERKRIGPFAAEEPDRERRQKAFAAMMRAGHPMEVVRRVLNTPPGEIPDSDNI